MVAMRSVFGTMVLLFDRVRVPKIFAIVNLVKPRPARGARAP